MKTTPTTQKKKKKRGVQCHCQLSQPQVLLPIRADAEPDSGLGFGWFAHTTNKHNK